MDIWHEPESVSELVLALPTQSKSGFWQVAIWAVLRRRRCNDGSLGLGYQNLNILTGKVAENRGVSGRGHDGKFVIIA